MSEELEALQQIKASHFQAHIESKNIADFDIWFEDYYNLLLKALTPPTADEVCKALSKWVKGNIPDIWNYKVYYDTGGFHYYNNCDFEEYLVEYERIDKAITLSVFLPPHLVEMIGKFYESLEEIK